MFYPVVRIDSVQNQRTKMDSRTPFDAMQTSRQRTLVTNRPRDLDLKKYGVIQNPIERVDNLVTFVTKFI